MPPIELAKLFSLDCPSGYIGNGKCNDECNKKAFDYDQGDCCFEYIHDIKCQDCICHLDDQKHPKGIQNFVFNPKSSQKVSRI